MAGEKTLGELLTEIKAEKSEIPRTTLPELWQPDVAILLSYFLTPIFGAYIHQENWSALGERGRARRSGIFFIISLVVVPGSAIISGITGNGLYFALIDLGMLLVWYVADARFQVRYVKERIGENFRRESWLRAISGAIAAFLAVGAIVYVLNELVFHIE